MVIIISMAIIFQHTLLTTSLQFPLREFFDLSNSSVDNKYIDDYRSYYTCEKSWHHDFSGCCDCSEYCLKVRRCCVDYLWTTQNHTNITHYKMLLEEMSRSEKYKILTCLTAIPHAAEKGFEVYTYFMVATCLPGSSFTEQRLCREQNNKKSIDSIMPVTGSDNYTYKNIHCAKCNHVDSIRLVKLRMECSEPENGKPSYCKVNLSDEDFAPPCNHQLINDCPKGNQYYDLCHAFVGPFNGYSNYFCFLCTNAKPVMIESGIVTPCHYWPRYMPFSWSSLLTFSDPLAKTTSEQGCSNDAFDTLLGKCATIHCPLGYLLTDSLCLKEESSTQEEETLLFDDCLSLQNSNLNLVNVTDPTKIIDFFGLRKFEKQIISDKEIYRLVFEDQSSYSFKVLTGLTEISQLLDSGEVIIINSMDKKQFDKKHLPAFVSNQRNSTVHCAEIELLNGDGDFNKNCDAILNDTVVRKWQSFMSIEIRKGEIKKYLHKCRSFSNVNGCHLIILQSNNVTIQRNGSMLYAATNNTNISYNNNQVVLVDEGVYGVCLEEKISSTKPLKNWYVIVRLIEGYLSVIGTCLSTISYIVLMYLYHQMRDTYNVPTLCSFALCFSLFCGDSIYLGLNIMHLIGANPSVLTCDIIGGSDRFFLISAHIWCIILAVDVSKSIKLTNCMEQAYKKTIFLRYCAIVCIVSVVIVAVGIVLRVNGILDEHSERRESCFFDVGPNERIMLRVVPLLLSFVISLLFISVTICYIARTTRQNESVLGKKNYIDLTRVALKLTIMSGIPEGIGLINIPNTTLEDNVIYVNMIFGLLYSITKGFRGVMLLYLFANNGSVNEKKSKEKQVNLGAFEQGKAPRQSVAV